MKHFNITGAGKATLVGVAICASLFVYNVAGVAQTPKPKRINRAIELLEQGQPIYYTGSHSGTIGTFEQGKQDAQTWADYISYDMEAAPYDVAGLSRSEEHTSELQSHVNLVCRLLLEKKKKNKKN